MSNYPKDIEPCCIVTKGEYGTIVIDPVDQIASDADEFNNAWVYEHSLTTLFSCEVSNIKAGRLAPSDEVFIHFELPTDVNYACNVPVIFSGVTDGAIKLMMRLTDLRNEVDFWDEVSAKGF
ncbi:hypothetical protein [Spirosoma sp. KUDC1026]|uniref:hypothetical protein n=1 Tax=Spirosoma sp. KUDC1026 TaxID=2745947 RepID=UPI00159BB956|nr:hypothetical protein [Spirosoma sp. KUDC1026]QKZ15155.1 hypothetical protein HU175_22040 [Spirosoma sp. KUDC1026]